MTPAADEIIARALQQDAAGRPAERAFGRRRHRVGLLLSLILLAHLGIMFGWMLTPWMGSP